MDNKFWLRVRSWVLVSIFIASTALTVLTVPTEAGALYGRDDQYQGYFTGYKRRTGYDYPCVGQLICHGVDSRDINQFVTFYYDKLTKGDSQSQRGAAFTILVMLGVSGPSSGGLAAGVTLAKNNFSRWEAIVRAYDKAHKINYDNNGNGSGFEFTTNTSYSEVRKTATSSTKYYDVVWRYDTDAALSITFDIGGGQYVAIKKACANLVGVNATLPPPPPLDFSLTPSISTNTSGAVEAGTPLTISASVSNTGSAASTAATWQLNSFQVSPNNNVPTYSGYDSGSEPCSFYTGAGVSGCGPSSFTGGGGSSGTFPFPVGTHNYTPRTDTADDLAAGTKLCYTHSVQPRAHDSGQWRHSAPACITIGKKPKVQVLGSDLLVGRAFMGLSGSPTAGNIQTSTSLRTVGSTIRTLGSWVEYGVQASGRIIGIGSGSAYGGSGLAGATICLANPLTFTNGTNSACANNGSFGGYQANQNIPDVGSSFPLTGSTASLGSNPSVNLSGLRGLYTATGNVSVSGGAINSGRWVVLNVPNSTVTITGNINYTNADLNSAGDIPQVVIIAKNINIQPGVTNIDAWLIAKGSATADGIINTCSTSGANDYKKLSPCDNKLTVNGPVMANKVYLRRTSNSSTGEPSEVFNLRPDAYMWAYARSVGGARAQTVYFTELPPRL